MPHHHRSESFFHSRALPGLILELAEDSLDRERKFVRVLPIQAEWTQHQIVPLSK